MDRAAGLDRLSNLANLHVQDFFGKQARQLRSPAPAQIAAFERTTAARLGNGHLRKIGALSELTDDVPRRGFRRRHGFVGSPFFQAQENVANAIFV